ncbi:MAG: hypothetical protein ACK56F_32075, partial [bacterium]
MPGRRGRARRPRACRILRWPGRTAPRRTRRQRQTEGRGSFFAHLADEVQPALPLSIRALQEQTAFDLAEQGVQPLAGPGRHQQAPVP